ncbi:GntR family transcriptional regulator [Streptomyces sp. NPDC020799]|uniref:GntR family transcriptional regulator n=1 Tax=unclassified Streptomyces TaxID=2593676 RepID=UPI003410F73B
MAVQYQLIADDLRRLIEAGEYEAGTQLPSERELAAKYLVSIPTLRCALDALQAEGLLDKFHGRGNFVRQPRERITYAGGGRSAGERGALDEALKVEVDACQVWASRALSALLDVPVDAPLAEYTFVGHVEHVPQTLARVYVPREVAELSTLTESRSPWGEEVRALLATAGVHVVSTVERVTARLPRTDEANLLRITTKAPVIAMERTAFDADGRVVELALLVLRGDHTEAVFTHRQAALPETENCVGSALRRLPWDSPEGKPCFLSAACADGALSRLADSVETEQTTAGAEVLTGAQAVLADADAGDQQLRFALVRAAESLGEVLRVAKSRGARLSVPDHDESGPDDDPSGAWDALEEAAW